MLAFLDSLCAALIAHDGDRIRSLLAHPLARALPHGVRNEATAILNHSGAGIQAPLETLRLYHQTMHLLGVSADPPAQHPTGAQAGTGSTARQMELPLERAVPA